MSTLEKQNWLKKIAAAIAGVALLTGASVGTALAEDNEIEMEDVNPAIANPPTGDNDQLLSDREPTPDERSMIEAKLREMGFVDYDEIELDDEDDLWEVDDAVNKVGEEVDVFLMASTLHYAGHD